MTRRKLTADEIDLWQEVIKKAERLHPSTHNSAPVLPLPKPMKHPVPRIDSFKLDSFKLGSRSRQKPIKHDLKPAITDRLFKAPVQMDQKAFTRMTRGKLRPEGKLDLHGMRIDSAHPALIRFILSAQASGKRLVLVVTGKGKDRDEPGPIPTPRGVLRHQVPQWLALSPLAQGVLQVTPAHISHGGSGAYYVYLRRSR
jgi:DNA-nicking Smr family endonuclease